MECGQIILLACQQFSILWPEQSLPVGTRGSGLSIRSRSTFTDLLTLAGEKSTGQSAALYLKQGACDHNNNVRPAELDWIFENQGCFWHRFASSQSKTPGCIMKRKNVFLSAKTGGGKSSGLQIWPIYAAAQSRPDWHRHTMTHVVVTRHSAR